MAPAAAATCLACRREWFGGASVDALRVIGGCTSCGGEVAFAADADERAERDVASHYEDTPAHLVLEAPRIEFG